MKRALKHGGFLVAFALLGVAACSDRPTGPAIRSPSGPAFNVGPAGLGVVSDYLHGTGPVFTLDNGAPTGASAKYLDSPSVNRTGFKVIGTWLDPVASPTPLRLQFSALAVWLGLKNSDDQGTWFDLKAEVLKNGVPVAEGVTTNIQDITRNASKALNVTVSLGPVDVDFSPGDQLGVRVSAKVTAAGGHSSAVGLRLYYDAANRASRIEFSALPIPANDQLAVGNFHACVIQANGQTVCWGSRGFAQPGDGAPTGGVAARVAVAGNPAFTKLATGGSHTCGTTVTGAILCWGRDDWGQVSANGTGGTGPRAVRVPTLLGGGPYGMVSPGRLTACGLTTSNVAVCWGINQNGELGVGDILPRLTPVPVATDLQFTTISAGWIHTCALTAAGEAYCWGQGNFLGQSNAGPNQVTPVLVAGGHVFTRLYAGGYHTCGLTGLGEAWCWGANTTGQLGDGNTTNSFGPPVPVSGGLFFSMIGTGDLGQGNVSPRSHTCGITLSGAAYCWGLNADGQLGDGTTTDRLVPTPVLTNEVFVAIGAGDRFSCAMTPDRRVFCWGINANGELGTGVAGGFSSTPVLVP